jgi:hypothetical protein
VDFLSWDAVVGAWCAVLGWTGLDSTGLDGYGGKGGVFGTAYIARVNEHRVFVSHLPMRLRRSGLISLSRFSFQRLLDV